MADLKQWLSEKDWIDLYKARQYHLSVDQQFNASGNCDSEFDEAWAESREKEKRSNPFWKFERKDREADKETEGTIDCRRKLIAKYILTLENETLAGLTHQGAKLRLETRAMLNDYYRIDKCLQCSKWLGASKTDPRADEILHHLVAEVVRVGEPVPAGLRKWASDALFSCRPKHQGRPKEKWYRDQKITLAVDVLVVVTHSSVGNALNIVADVCQEIGNGVNEPESVKTIRDRVIREARKEEAEAVKR